MLLYHTFRNMEQASIRRPEGASFGLGQIYPGSHRDTRVPDHLVIYKQVTEFLNSYKQLGASVVRIRMALWCKQLPT